MMKSALTIIQDFRKRAGLSTPTTLLSITDPDELQLIELLTNVCEELRQARCWTQQKRKHSITTTASRRAYPLPQDFYAPIFGTDWNEDEQIRLNGAETDEEFTYRLYGTGTSTTNFSYRIFGPDEGTGSTSGQLVLDPIPADAVDISFEYLSRNLFQPKFWTSSTAFAAGSYCSSNGQIYKTTAGGTTGSTAPTGTGTVSDGVVSWVSQSFAYETILADTDLVIFDYDLVKLGLRAKWYEEHGGAWETAGAEFELKINQAVARMTKPRKGSFAGKGLQPRYKVPYKGWSI